MASGIARPYRRAMETGHDLSLVNVWPTLLAASEEARRTRHPHIGSEHLALLALDGPDGIEAMAIESGLDASAIRAAIEACCDAAPTDDEPVVTPRTARMVAFASQIALIEHAPEIRPVDLIAVLLNDPGAIAWRGLMAAGVGPDVLSSGMTRRRRGEDQPVRRN
jgi:ATP-dependent Clp protease ATP-binding subunit ClpA